MTQRISPHICMAALALGLSSAAAQASDFIAQLDAAGRQIAQRPCDKPRLTSVTRPNVHDASLRDRFDSFRCAKAQGDIQRSSQTAFKTAMPLSASTRLPDARLPAKLRVGAPIAQVRALLGPPEQDEGGVLSYATSENSEDAVYFEHAAGRVTRIEWTWYVD